MIKRVLLGAAVVLVALGACASQTDATQDRVDRPVRMYSDALEVYVDSARHIACYRDRYYYRAKQLSCVKY